MFEIGKREGKDFGWVKIAFKKKNESAFHNEI